MSSMRGGTIYLRIFLNSLSKRTTSDSVLSSSSPSSSSTRGFSSVSTTGSVSGQFPVRDPRRRRSAFRDDDDDNHHFRDDRPSRYESRDNAADPVAGRPVGGERRMYNQTDSFSRRKPSPRRDDGERGNWGIRRSTVDRFPENPKDDRQSRHESHDNPADRIPDRPLGGERRMYNQTDSFSRRKPNPRGDDGDRGNWGIPRSTADRFPKNSKDDRQLRYESHDNPADRIPDRPSGGDWRMYNQTDRFSRRKPSPRGDDGERGNWGIPRSTADGFFRNVEEFEDSGSRNEFFRENRRMMKPCRGEERDGQFSEQNVLERNKPEAQKWEKPFQSNTRDPKTKEGQLSSSDPEAPEPEMEPDPPNADEVFNKMKETGLIPNAVAMLDGLCKDGHDKEAMKLFHLMRERGTFPEVVIYTAVVEGFCKAQKHDDAKRIFRKMQSKGISPNAFSYTVLIQGFYKGKRLEDAVEFSVEMLEAGHSPNVATFVGLVDLVCREKNLEEAQSVVDRLRQKGYFADGKAIREYLYKNTPFLPMIKEAIFGKKSSRETF